MTSIEKVFNYITNSNFRFVVKAVRGKYDYLSDEEYLKRMFKAKAGYELDLDNPKTFNAKLQWLKINDRNPIYTTMVDKYCAKTYVSEKVGEEYIIPTLGIWNTFEDIDFNMLPKQFVLKTTHDSGTVLICKDKSAFDYELARSKLTKALNRNYYYLFREYQYRNVEPRIMAEKYMEDESGVELKDYKVLCFEGAPKLIEMHSGRFTDHQIEEFYDINWNKQTISQTGNKSHYHLSDTSFPKPASLEKMLELSSSLAAGIHHIRVDWYSINGRLYFGELTFYDGSGFEKWDDPKDELMMGSWIKLPTDR